VSFGKKISAVETTNKSALTKELKVSRSSLYYRPKKPDKLSGWRLGV
jgi:transcriptional regulator with PAS, ATPase and Fis domain